MAERLCKTCGKWHDLLQPWPHAPQPRQRSSLPFPMIISDDMPPAEHVDGKVYTSKRAFRAVTNARGYIELGTEKQKPYVPPKPDRKAIRESLERARARLNA